MKFPYYFNRFAIKGIIKQASKCEKICFNPSRSDGSSWIKLGLGSEGKLLSIDLSDKCASRLEAIDKGQGP